MATDGRGSRRSCESRYDWDTAYSLFAEPEIDFATAEREWAETDESHAYFDVQETLVSDGDSAQVRVTYEVTTTPPGGPPYTVTVDEPGEWWRLSRVDGLWKVHWLPRQ